MKLIRTGGDRSYWRADDEGGLWFRDGWEKPEPPTTAEAYLVGHSGLVRDATRTIELADLEYVCKAFFGPPRGNARPDGEGGWLGGWTGDYCKYALYLLRNEFATPDAVIMRHDGGGHYFYVIDELESHKAWPAIALALPEPLRWTLFNSYAHTYHAGAKAGERKMGRLFLEDRLKKRRKGGAVRLEVLPEKKEVALG